MVFVKMVALDPIRQSVARSKLIITLTYCAPYPEGTHQKGAVGETKRRRFDMYTLRADQGWLPRRRRARHMLVNLAEVRLQ